MATTYKAITLILVLMVAEFCRAQADAQISKPVDGKIDTSAWYRRYKKSIQYGALPNLVKSKERLHFRYAGRMQDLDIWTNDYKVFNGALRSHTYSSDYNGKSDDYYRAKTDLDTASAAKVYRLFMALKIFEIPTGDSIAGWDSKNQLDGEGFTIEYSDAHLYTCKSYFSPYAYKEVKEARIIDTLVKQLETMLQMSKVFHAFICTLPKGEYSAGKFCYCLFAGAEEEEGGEVKE